MTIVSDLPRNAPAHLKAAFENYDDELKVRDVQPILGLLKDMAAIIGTVVRAADSREWLATGVLKAIGLFQDNHDLFVTHFPLDPAREELYAHTPVDEMDAVGRILSAPFEEGAQASLGANRAGLTTDDFLKIVDRMAKFAKIISNLLPSRSIRVVDRRAEVGPDLRATVAPVVPPQYKELADDPPISVKKRVLLSGFGFFERACNLLGTSAQLAGPAV
jgi:hypothetical protein